MQRGEEGDEDIGRSHAAAMMMMAERLAGEGKFESTLAAGRST